VLVLVADAAGASFDDLDDFALVVFGGGGVGGSPSSSRSVGAVSLSVAFKTREGAVMVRET
jgi:hypothetical protein